MAWIRVKGLKGRVYQPESALDTPRKHPCPDCHACRMCSDARCADCRKRKRQKG